jgi:hypothetical protein
MGIVSSLGVGLDKNWDDLMASKSGVTAVDNFDVSDLPAKIAGQVPKGNMADGLFNADDWVPTKDQRRMDDFIIYGLCAAQQAIEDSGWTIDSDEDAWRTGVLIGSGIGGLPEIADGSVKVHEGRTRRLSPFFHPGQSDQSHFRTRFHSLWAERPQPRGGDSLLHRGACHRRCGPDHHVGGRRRDGGRWRGSSHMPYRYGWLLLGPCALNGLQRSSDGGIAALGPGS